MKIRLNDSTFGEYNGTTIDVELDHAELDSSGEVILPTYIRDATDRYYAYTDEYEVVNENVIPGGYTLELQAKDLIQLHAMLDALPEFMLDSATLKMN